MRYLQAGITVVFVLFSYLALGQLAENTFRAKRTFYLTDNKKQTPLDSVVENAAGNYIQSPQNCGLSIGVFKNDSIYFYNYGETKMDNKVLPDKNTIYEIGSVTKTFCGILLAYAVTEGKIRPEDDIRNYLPEKYPNLETNKQFIQVKHLANHTSGLPRVPENITAQPDYNKQNPYKNYDKKMIFDYLKSISLSTEPGEICEYSNLGMALLGIILENIYNKSFEELVKEKICAPNAMNSTTIDLTADELKRFADGYNADGEPTPHWDLGAFAPAGAIRSSAADMINYLNYNINEKDAATKLAHQSTFNKNSNVALAWHLIITKYNNQLIWHNGGTFGFSSFCGLIKEQRTGVVVLSNSGTNVDFIGLSILKFLQNTK